jgi:hypothetical protein
MGAKPEDTEREIGHLRQDADSAVTELLKRFGGGASGLAGGELRASSAQAAQQLRQSAASNPSVLGVAGAVAVGVVGFLAYRAYDGWRESRKPQNRLKTRVEDVRDELEERVGQTRDRLRKMGRRDLYLKTEPDKTGYLRVTDVRVDSPGAEAQKERLTVLKKLLWAGMLSVFMAVSSVLARRAAGALWQASVGELPPPQKTKSSSS